jgi:hypothetical protein
MDDDLRAVATLLAPPAPAPDAVDRSRHLLEQRLRHPRRPRPARWVPAVAATAAAATGAIVFAATVGTAPAPHDQPRTVASPSGSTSLSGRQVLLAAATSAERQTVGTGRYWHVTLRIVNASDRTVHYQETWTSRDGNESWQRTDRTGGRLVRRPTPVRYGFAYQQLTAAQLAALPTDAARLRAWAERAAARGQVGTPGGSPNRFMRRDNVMLSLAALLSGYPAPPKVRAAAMRALATYPGVRGLGPVDGGEAIQLPVAVPGAGRMVVDPRTGQVRNTNFFSWEDGAVDVTVPGTTATIVGTWTDTVPTS